MAVRHRGARSGPGRPGPSAAVLRWPVDADRRPGLLDEGRPCLWLLPFGELVPELGPSEDWARLPIDERDLHARLQRLVARGRGGPGLVAGEVVLEDGLLTFRDRRVVVPVLEATILAALAAEPGAVVGRQALTEVAWPGAGAHERALDSRIHSLRVRLAPLGLAIHTVRGRGFLLAAEPDPSHAPVPGRATPRRTPWSSS